MKKRRIIAETGAGQHGVATVSLGFGAVLSKPLGNVVCCFVCRIEWKFCTAYLCVIGAVFTLVDAGPKCAFAYVVGNGVRQVRAALHNLHGSQGHGAASSECVPNAALGCRGMDLLPTKGEKALKSFTASCEEALKP